MSELLAQNRERLLAVLHIAQTQLGECVAELKSHSAHKARMDELQKWVTASRPRMHSNEGKKMHGSSAPLIPAACHAHT